MSMVKLPNSENTFVQFCELPENALFTFPRIPLDSNIVIETTANHLRGDMSAYRQLGINFSPRYQIESDYVASKSSLVYRSTRTPDMYICLEFYAISYYNRQPIFAADPNDWDNCRLIRLGGKRLAEYNSRLHPNMTKPIVKQKGSNLFSFFGQFASI